MYGLVRLKALADDKCSVEKVNGDGQPLELQAADLSQQMRIMVNAALNEADAEQNLIVVNVLID